MTGTVMVFSGCTPLQREPVRSLASREPRFAEVLAQCDAVLREEAGWSLWEIWEADREVADLPRNFPLMVSFQIAMFESLHDRGVDPDAVIGISSGEVSAAYAAGVIGLRDALRIAVHGGRAMQPIAARCRMALVWRSADACRAMTERVSLAAIIAPELSVISGLAEEVASVQNRLAQAQVPAHSLPLPWGVHTPLLPERHPEFEAVVGEIDTHRARYEAFSTSTGTWTDFAFDASQWWRMFRSPVLFESGIRALLDRGFSSFVDAGPSATLDALLPRFGAHPVATANALAMLS